MRALLQDAERLIRGDLTRPDDLADGHIDLSPGSSARIVVVFGALAGALVGVYSLSGGWTSAPQLLASTVKLPLMFIITVGVCFPSLFVFSALFGARLPLGAVLRLVWSHVAVMVMILASFGPIVAFFGLTGPSYGFMVLLNVITAGLSGLLGLGFLLRTLDRVIRAQAASEVPGARAASPTAAAEEGALSPAEGAPPDDSKSGAPGPLDPDVPLHERTKLIFRVWVVLFGMVGAQSSWLLRPLIGSPDLPFQLFRAKEGTFLTGVFNALAQLLP
ncbi:MAG: hypothetical protein AAFU79_32665 [Myxococcota bacterium]